MEYLLVAYAVVGLGLLVYLVYVGNQLKDLRRQLNDVVRTEQRVDGADQGRQR